MMPEQKERLKMIRMKGYKGYVWHGFKKIAQEYNKVKWGNGAKPREVVETPFKKTYKF